MVLSKSKQFNANFKQEGTPNACISLDENIINIKAPHKIEPLSKKEKIKLISKVYKSYKKVCNRCGAFIPLSQLACGMCMSFNIRKVYKNEIQQILQELYF